MPCRDQDKEFRRRRRYLENHENRSSNLAVSRKWKKEHQEQVMAIRRRYYLEDRERFCEEGKAWRKDNVDRVKLNKHKYGKEHRLEIRARVNKWRSMNRDLVRAGDKRHRTKNRFVRNMYYCLRALVIKDNLW